MSDRTGIVALFLVVALAAASAPLRAQQAASADSSTGEAASTVSAPAAAATFSTVPIVLTTNLGDIRVALESERAPLTTQNFLKYVDAKRFDGTTIYRAVKVGDEGEYGLIQGGLQGDRKKAFPPVAHEPARATGVSNTDGAISMARAEPGSATGDFFFVLGDLIALDGNAETNDVGYAAFGHVTQGKEILRTILGLPRSEAAANPAMQGQMLAHPIKILSVRRE
jgi:peptidyl-prolyl cis-trans isomerase A (cyclophilin A)